MDELQTFGNLNLPVGTAERPLVSFALFAYNQDQFIHEAVKAAFSQTYSPLEVILSDDCSSDATYAMIKEMASSYNGCHRIRIRKSNRNLGLSAHINAVADLAKGLILIMAAGDDRSEAHRTEKLVNEFVANQSVHAVFSNYCLMPSAAQDCNFGSFCKVVSMIEMIAAGGGVQIGATYAYRREVFSWPNPLPNWILSEDRILPLRASLLGGVHYLPEPLVAYRVSSSPIVKRQKRARNNISTLPQHFREVHGTLVAARAQGLINFHVFLLCAGINSLVSLSNHFRQSGSLGIVFAKVLYFPVRLIRTLSRLRFPIPVHCNTSNLQAR